MASQLEQLQDRCTIAVETADLRGLQLLGARDVHLTIARMTAAAQLPEHHDLVDAALRWAQGQVGKAGRRKLVALRAVERLAVEFALRALDRVAGRVSVEIDSRLAFNTGASVERARDLTRQLVAAGADAERILVRLPATREGIAAAAKLEQAGIHCHLTLVFAMVQLTAAADIGATLVSPAVGRISDWHAKQAGVKELPPESDPGILLVREMGAYLTAHGLPTELCPATFRTVAQALALADCPSVSLPPALLEQLEASTDAIPEPRAERGELTAPTRREPLDAAAFAAELAADPVGASKLAQGVKNASWAMVNQEKQLIEWIATRQDEAAKRSAETLFEIWDFDGDGFIDREEWGGTEEVFNALDRNHDGRISLDEMVLGLGAPSRPER